MTSIEPTPEHLDGYYGNLTPSQEKTLQDLKDKLAKEDGIVSEASPIAEHLRIGIYSDPVFRFELELLRYLRARKFDLTKTYDMYRKSRYWRQQVDLDRLYREFDYAKAQAAFRSNYPTYIHRIDASGSPVHIHEISKINLEELFKIVTREEAIQYLYLLSESNLRERFPACTLRMHESDIAVRPNYIVDTVTGIFDLQGVGLRGFWRVKDILQQLIEISDNHYPETANKLVGVRPSRAPHRFCNPEMAYLQFIINAPGIFSRVWTYLKGWLDVRTASRVFVLDTQYSEKLLEHIANTDLPAHLGGTCACCDLPGGCRSGDVGPWKTTGSALK